MLKKIYFLFAVIVMIIMQGCNVVPSLTYNYIPSGEKIDNIAPVKKIVVMKSLDRRTHAGTTPKLNAFIPFFPFVKTINEPETFIYYWNSSRFDYESDFSELVAVDLRASGIASNIMVSPDTGHISPLVTGKEHPDYIIKLVLNRMDWQNDFTMYGISILGYLPQLFGAPTSYGYSYLKFTAEILDSHGKILAKKVFSATQKQNGWIYYYTGYLRALTKAYKQVSPELREFIAASIFDNSK
jgi:hypothetical protein